jgi:hypothetical protein
MNGLEANCRNLACISQATSFGSRQLLQARSHRDGVIGYGSRDFLAVTADLDETRARVGTNPFDPAAGQLALVGHIEQSVLKARRSEVCYENLHQIAPVIREWRRTSVSFTVVS